MKKKLLALIMTACMVTTMFTACGKADSPAASETEGQNTAENNTESGEKETIEFWDMIWGSDADAYEATVREICEQVGEEIGANVEVRFLPWDNFTQVYLTAVASGTAPDVGTTGTTLPSQVHMMGGTMNLNSILEDWKAENNPILDAIPQEDMNFRRYLYRGKANALVESILLAMGRNINKLHCKIQTGRTGSHLFSLKTA